jgi:hypothetical protein
MLKYNTEQIKQECSKRGFNLLDEYIGARIKMNMECIKCKNICKITLSNLKAGNKCKYCNIEEKRLKIENIKKQYIAKGFALLENHYDNNNTKMKTQCDTCKYIWPLSYANMKKIKKCPKCSGTIKHTLEEAKIIFKKGYMTLIEDNYFDNQTPMSYVCGVCNYNGKKILNSVIRGQKCPKCAIKKQIIPFNEVLRRVDKCNLIYLGTKYDGEEWFDVKCKKCNHEFPTKMDYIQKGNRCIRCCCFKSENHVIKTAENLLGKPFHKDNKLLGNKLQCDGVNHEKKVIVEYNGIQHYIWPNIFFEKEEDFIRQQERDKLKLIRAKEKGYNIIVVPYTIKFPHIEHFLKEEFIKIGMDVL